MLCGAIVLLMFIELVGREVQQRSFNLVLPAGLEQGLAVRGEQTAVQGRLSGEQRMREWNVPLPRRRHAERLLLENLLIGRQLRNELVVLNG